jgi:Tannase and feruloyl esterase
VRNFLFLLAILLSVATFPVPAQGSECHALAQSALPETTIMTAEPVSGGSFIPSYGTPLTGLPAFCRVSGILHPTSDSVIRFEVWMPEKGWNHRFLGIGNGGFAGSIYYGQLGESLKRGFATAGTDAGHQADAQDASWAYQHPEKITDFGYRAVHLTADRAKAIINMFYGEPPMKSYFDACSDGGREALMEAQRFPADYDGILAGAPANNWTKMLAATVDVAKMFIGNPEGYIPSIKLPAITAAVLAQCDAQDGLKDGILADPRTCHFDPATLLCKLGDELSCLTTPQIASLKKIYAGGTDDKGHLIFPGLMPGDEMHLWKSWVVGEGPSVSLYTQNYFRYMVFGDPTWDALAANTEAVVHAADAKTAPALNATDPDLSRFAARGGKLILYHGWNDPAISPLNTVRYYEQVQVKMGEASTTDFVRLYMVPGMGHCAAGAGAANFGQLGLTTAKGPEYGIFDALEKWEELKIAPDTIIATKYGATGKVEMTRPICPYPQAAKYNGNGDPNDSASFTCVAPGQ